MLQVHRISLDSVDSTQTWGKEHVSEFDSQNLTCIIAKKQTGGYGRRGHTWVSRTGNLHMTLYFCLEKGDLRIENLSQLMALSIAKIFPLRIKWPNDLIFEGKKCAGLITELLDRGEEWGVLLGMGMNVNAEVETDQPTISLKEITGKEWDLDDLVSLFVGAFKKEFEKGFYPNDFEVHLAYLDQPISCQFGGQTLTGIFRGIDERGRLLLEQEKGEIRLFDSADINQLRQRP